MDDFVEVLDIVVITTVPGVVLRHTVRAHEGDKLESKPEFFRIYYGDKEVLVGGEKRKVAGRSVTIPQSHTVEITESHRFEPRLRPTVASLVTGKAEIDARLEEALAQVSASKTKS